MATVMNISNSSDNLGKFSKIFNNLMIKVKIFSKLRKSEEKLPKLP